MVCGKFIQKSKMVNGDWVLGGIGLGGRPSLCPLASIVLQRRALQKEFSTDNHGIKRGRFGRDKPCRSR